MTVFMAALYLPQHSGMRRSRHLGENLIKTVEHELRCQGVDKLWGCAKVPDYYTRLGWKLFDGKEKPVISNGQTCSMKNLKLKAARAEKDLSQQALADIVGVSRQTVNAIEKGDYNPSINLCIAICKALDKTLDDLFWE